MCRARPQGCYEKDASHFPFRLSVCRVVLQIPRVRHAPLVVDMSATCQTLLTCRDGLKVASILIASSTDMSDTTDFLVTC